MHIWNRQWENVCLQYLPHYHKQYSFWWSYKEINTEYWKGTARLTVPRNLSAMYVLNTFCATRVWKLKILQRICELISAFATQKFWCFWKRICPRILHPKNQKFHHLLSFTSSLRFPSKIMSSMMPSMCKVVC